MTDKTANDLVYEYLDRVKFHRGIDRAYTDWLVAFVRENFPDVAPDANVAQLAIELDDALDHWVVQTKRRLDNGKIRGEVRR